MSQNSGTDEIDLLELISKVWQGRKIAIIFSLLGFLFGAIFALSKPNVYTATTTFILKGQSNTSVSGGLGNIASLAGINIGGINNTSSAIPLAFYPNLIKSNPFIESLIKLRIPKDGEMIELQDYLGNDNRESGALTYLFSNLRKYTLDLPKQIKNSFLNKKENVNSPKKNGTIRRLTPKEQSIYDTAKGLISLQIDQKDGFVTLSVDLDNPELAASIALNTQNLLQKEVIDYTIKNAQELLAFTEKLYAEKKMAFEVMQDELAIFRDKHQNISSELFQNKLRRLEAEFVIANSINAELAKQVEQARIQVSKDTPIFTIIDPVVVPNQKSSPNRTLIVIGCTLFGFFLGLCYSIFKGPFAKIRKQILELSKNSPI